MRRQDSRPKDSGTEDSAYGTLERRPDGLSVLRYRRRLAHPPQKVWRALTEDAHLAEWFPTTIEGTRAAGATLRFSFREGEAEPFDGEMLAFDAPTLMELRWADDVLRFELSPDGAGCVLDLTVTFPEYAKAARDAAGWHVCLEQLGYVCDGSPLPWRPPDRWREVHRGYVERFGPAASALGPPEDWERVHGGDAVQ
ncbi:MAG TPA: SRPBCC family protein [Acidimicrobiales bacterium]|nr:SRPBCC family protein [Acidimicrobiales bacterium]